MPTYEYRCNACGRDFEYVQRMSDDDLVKCEACGEDKLEKLISRTAFQLKGSGWYKDLYSSSKPAETPKDSGSSSPSTDAPAAKADAPAASSSTSSDSSSSSGSGTSTTTASPAASTPSKTPSSAS